MGGLAFGGALGGWGRGPEAEEEFGEVAHAGAAEAFAGGGLAEGGDDAGAFDVVIPEVALEGEGGGVGVGGGLGGGFDAVVPEGFLVGLLLEVVEDELFVAVEAHGSGDFLSAGGGEEGIPFLAGEGEGVGGGGGGDAVGAGGAEEGLEAGGVAENPGEEDGLGGGVFSGGELGHEGSGGVGGAGF